MQSKLVFVLAAVTLALVGLGGVLIYIAQVKGDEYSQTVLAQQDYSSTTIAFRRGTITDRNKTVLAASEQVYNLILDPKVILAGDEEDVTATVNALAAVYGYDVSELTTLLEENSSSSYIRYARQLSEEEMTAFTDYRDSYNDEDAGNEGTVSSSGVWFESEYERVYPLGTFACTLLGFSSSDSSRGNWGIEEYYNDYLTGTDGREYGYINSDGVAEREVVEAEDGCTIVSTIDYTIQASAEAAIQEFLEEYEADNVAVIVMDPNTGEILAMATDKVYDLNDPTELSAYYTEEEEAAMTSEELSEARAEIWKNFCVQDAYEPGSTSKPFTVAAALEEDLISTEDTWLCNGYRTYGSTTISCMHTHNTVTLAEALMYSCNVAMMDISGVIGADLFTAYQSLFGFGKQTNIDLPGETTGLVYTAEEMGSTDLATNSFGQNYNVNMVQMISAFCSLVNGGSYYQPHVVKQILSADGDVVENIEPTLVRQTVSESTSEFIREALYQTVEEGTGTSAQIDGYAIGGKTGTAQKHPRSDNTYLVSFIGFAPVDDPEVVVYVVVDNPVMTDGTSASASLAIGIARNIMEDILPYMNISTIAESDEDSEEEETEAETAAEETEAEAEAEEGTVVDENGNTLSATASAADEEVVPEDGYLDIDDNVETEDSGEDAADESSEAAE